MQKISAFLKIFFFLWSCSMSSQYMISGKVIDKNKEKLPFVNILLQQPEDSKLIKGAITDEEGKFELNNIKEGSYILVINQLGFRDLKINIEATGDVDAGELILEEQTEELEEVVIKQSRPLFEQKTDRVIINVQENSTTAGGSVLEVLERSPGVNVDRQQNTLSMSGKEGVQVMVNGKVVRLPINSVLQMLKGMSADNIKKIELITNPSAKYEAASNAGIISIEVIKGENLGFNGIINAMAGYGIYEKAGGGVNLNFRKGKTNVFSDISYRNDHSRETIENFREIYFGNDTFSSRSENKRFIKNNNFSGRFGIDHNISDRSIIGLMVSGYSDQWNVDGNTLGLDSDTRVNSSVDYTGENDEFFRQNHFASNLNYVHKFKNDSDITFDIDYLYYKNDNPTDFDYAFTDTQNNTNSVEQIRIEKETPINIWTSRLDYSKKIGKITVETGVKGISSELSNQVIYQDNLAGAFTVDDDLSDDSELSNKIGAVYGVFDYKGEKNQFNIGLRYEYSRIELNTPIGRDNVDLTYSEIFPSFSYARKLNDNTRLILSYARKIVRPAYTDLAPYFVFINPTTYHFGNTGLEASIGDDVSLKLMYKKYTASFTYNRGDNAIVKNQPAIVGNSVDQIITPINLDYRDTYSLNLSLPFKVTHWWNMNINLLGVNKRIKSKTTGEDSQSYFRINGSQTFKLPSNFTIDLSGFYQSESISGITKIIALRNITLGVSKEFSESSKLRFSFSNIFGFKFARLSNDDIPDLNFRTRIDQEYEPRIFKLSYTYSFGNNKLKPKRNRSTGSEEIKNRVN